MKYLIQAKIINYEGSDWFNVMETEKGEHDNYRNILNRFETIRKEKDPNKVMEWRLLEIKEQA